MTCIVAYVDNESKVWMGADSAATEMESGEFAIRKDVKLFKINDNIMFGCAGSPRFRQVLQYSTEIPTLTKNDDPEDYLVNHLIPNMREAFELHGCLSTDDDGDLLNGNILIALNDRIFTLYGDYAYCETVKQYISCGSGAPYALGTLYALEQNEGFSNMSGNEIVTLALQSSVEWNAYCKAPFNIICIGCN